MNDSTKPPVTVFEPTHRWKAFEGDFPCTLTGKIESDPFGGPEKYIQIIYVDPDGEEHQNYARESELVTVEFWEAEQARARINTPPQTPPPGDTYFSVITATTPDAVGKTFALDANGKLTKSSVASISAGRAETIEATAANLVAALKRTTESAGQVLLLDSFKGAKPGEPGLIGIVTETALERLIGGKIPDVADPGFFTVGANTYSARLKRLMQSSGWILLDGDSPEGMPAHWVRLPLAERLKLLEAILPGVSRCLRIEYAGSSARVVKSSGQLQAEPTHALIQISDPDMLDQLRAYVHVPSVLQDLSFPSPRYSRLQPGKIIGYAHLTLIDLAVFVIGRLIFNARPDVSGAPGYNVLGANPRIVNPKGGVLDIGWLRPPDAEQVAAYRAKTGCVIKFGAGGGRGLTAREDGSLSLDTEIEVRGKVQPLGDWLVAMLDADVEKMRCEAPFRASDSEAALIRICGNGDILVYDSGVDTNYFLAPMPQTKEEIVAVAPTFVECETLMAVFLAFARRTQRQAKAAFPQSTTPAQNTNSSTAKLILISGANIMPAQVKWTWRHWLQSGAFNLLAGQSTAGKSTLALRIAAIITTGGQWPDETRAEQGCVVFWSGEDAIDDTLLPRFLASGGDPRFIHFIRGVEIDGKKRLFNPATDMAAVAEAVRSLGAVKLIVLDPVAVVVKGDSHKNTETRVGLQPFANLCMVTKACGLGIHHFTKGSAGGNPLDRVTGSLAFHALPRCVLAAARDQNGGRNPRRAVMRAKITNGEDYGGFEYLMEQHPLENFPHITAQRAVFGDWTSLTAAEVLASFDGKAAKDATEGTKAVLFLAQALKDGPRPSAEVVAEASFAGIPERTLRRARTALGGTAERESFGSPTLWALPVKPL